MLKVIYKKDLSSEQDKEQRLLKILAYFAVFEFPLTADEIRRFLAPGILADCIENTLLSLTEQGVIYKLDKYYSLYDQPEWARRKQEGFLQAKELLPRAQRVGRFLARFPFVTGVGISGGLSKMSATEHSDFDFFIVTRANRLWLARTLLHLYKKFTYLTGTEHFHCMNFFIDETALALRDRNMYTAVETMTLVPVCGEGLQQFYQANSWVRERFADYQLVMEAETRPIKRSWLRRGFESLLANRLGNAIDSYLMRITARRWRKKEREHKLSPGGKTMSLNTGKHYAWSNPGSFQQRTLARYQREVNLLSQQWPEYFQRISYSFGG